MDLSSTSGERPPEIPPGIRPGDLPAFHKLGEYVFQELCRDLLDADEEISYCEVYGVRGQAQYGVDLLAARRQQEGYDVGQCKAYATFTPAQIRAATNDFLEHHEFWMKRNVRRAAASARFLYVRYSSACSPYGHGSGTVSHTRVAKSLSRVATPWRYVSGAVCKA